MVELSFVLKTKIESDCVEKTLKSNDLFAGSEGPSMEKLKLSPDVTV
jgi:hypothetical protein